jgi:hypothetical protein
LHEILYGFNVIGGYLKLALFNIVVIITNMTDGRPYVRGGAMISFDNVITHGDGIYLVAM